VMQASFVGIEQESVLERFRAPITLGGFEAIACHLLSTNTRH
jgi:hypothetical protein